MYMTDYAKYYMLNFDTITDRKFRKLLVSKKDIYQQRIDMNRIDFNSIKFENMPEDIHVLGCWYNFNMDMFTFIVEHESFLRLPKGAEFEAFLTNIISCIRLIKTAKNL